MKAVLILVALLGVSSFEFGCKKDTGPAVAATLPSETPGVTLKIGREDFKLEVVATDDLRQRGLMYRKSMPADVGMIFIFKEEQNLAFWMHNTYIPLDILYLNASGKVVSIKQMAAQDEHTTPSDAPAKFAIELNKDAAARCGVKVGDVIALPPAVMNPPDLE